MRPIHLEVFKDTERALLAACAEMHAMRRDLIAAFGLKESRVTDGTTSEYTVCIVQ